MRAVRRPTAAERAITPDQFERLLQLAERVRKPGGPRLIAKPQSTRKRRASAA